jgi:hypothetical protein
MIVEKKNCSLEENMSWVNMLSCINYIAMKTIIDMMVSPFTLIWQRNIAICGQSTGDACCVSAPDPTSGISRNLYFIYLLSGDNLLYNIYSNFWYCILGREGPIPCFSYSCMIYVFVFRFLLIISHCRTLSTCRGFHGC